MFLFLFLCTNDLFPVPIQLIVCEYAFECDVSWYDSHFPSGRNIPSTAILLIQSRFLKGFFFLYKKQIQTLLYLTQPRLVMGFRSNLGVDTLKSYFFPQNLETFAQYDILNGSEIVNFHVPTFDGDIWSPFQMSRQHSTNIFEMEIKKNFKQKQKLCCCVEANNRKECFLKEISKSFKNRFLRDSLTSQFDVQAEREGWYKDCSWLFVLEKAETNGEKSVMLYAFTQVEFEELRQVVNKYHFIKVGKLFDY